MRIARIALMIMMVGIILWQQKKLDDSYGYSDMIYTAFKTCVSTQMQIKGIDPI